MQKHTLVTEVHVYIKVRSVIKPGPPTKSLKVVGSSATVGKKCSFCIVFDLHAILVGILSPYKRYHA